MANRSATSATPVREPRLAPVRSQSLRDQAYAAIRASILDGRFEPGELLIEGRIAQQLGVSRGPVRDALHDLVEDGLVVDQPRSGTYVRELDGEDLVDIYNLRLAIESIAIRLCIRRGAETGPLRALIDEMRSAARGNDSSGVVERELRFHEQLCSDSGNSELLRMFQRLEGPVHLALAMDDALYENLDDIAEEHLPIVEAIDARDEALAVAVMYDHVMMSIGVVVERLGGDPSTLLQPLPRR
jgi:DNA-binding GntR family transcriptional regulator